MCERTCPKCGATEHFENFGICGMSLVCAECMTVLAARFDEAAAPLDEADPEAYARARTFVILGAEAVNPADDAIFANR